MLLFYTQYSLHIRVDSIIVINIIIIIIIIILSSYYYSKNLKLNAIASDHTLSIDGGLNSVDKSVWSMVP
jgi:hypothetical protein